MRPAYSHKMMLPLTILLSEIPFLRRRKRSCAPHKVSRRSFEVKPNYPQMLNFSSATESKYIMQSCYTEIVNGKSTPMYVERGCSQGKQDSCWSSAMVQEQVGVGRVFTKCTFIELFSGKTFSFLHSSIPEFSKYCSLRSHLHSTQQACFNQVPLDESTMLHGLYHTFQQCQDERVDSQRVARVKRVDMRAGGCWKSHLQARNRLPPIQMAYNSRVHCAHLTNTSFSFTCIIYLCFDAEAGFHRTTCTPHTSQCRPQTGAEGFFLHAIEDGDGEVSCTRATALLALHALRSAAVLQLFSSS